MLTVFDAANALGCYRRTETVVPQQALAMTNSELAINSSRRLVRQLWEEVSSAHTDDAKRTAAFIRAAFVQILSRMPTDAELAAGERFLPRQAEVVRKNLAAAAAETPGKKPDNPQQDSKADAQAAPANAPKQRPPEFLLASSDAHVRARESLVRALFSHSDFVTLR